MKKLLGFVALAVTLGFGAWTYADMGKSSAGATDKGTTGAADKSGAMGTETASGKALTGEVLRIEGENYTVKDASGKEVRLHVNNDTKKEGDIKVGDKIEAKFNPDGHATWIKASR
jgi:hypothetical protein